MLSSRFESALDFNNNNDQYFCTVFRQTTKQLSSKSRASLLSFVCAFVRPSVRSFIFCSPESLGSQGELIVYPSSRRPSFGVRPPFLKIFSETAWPIKAKFYVGLPYRGNQSFYKWSRSHEKDGRHGHIW